ncbi:NAD-binding protein [Candidatus Jorgensenbacteria bacterium]|nr:NAD-binding protein [Candidatus Jorgensenbacteria bacterium]
MTHSNIIILGSGHLALQTNRRLTEAGYKVSHVSSDEFEEIKETNRQESSFEYAKAVIEKSDIKDVSAVCILDDDDGRNIQLLLASLALNDRVPTIVALSNESLAAHLAVIHKNVLVCNPAAIAAPHFANALYKRQKDDVLPISGAKTTQILNSRTDRLILKLIVGFFCIILIGASFFYFTENISWIDSFYLIATVITSANFNDAIVRNYSPEFKLVRTFIMLAVQFFIILAFTMIIDQLIKRRTELLVLGKRRHNLRDHIIVCGLGRVGSHLIEELLIRGERVLVIDDNTQNRFLETLRSRSVTVLVGDAALPKNLRDAGIKNAKGLFSVVNNDLENMEIGLNARALQPNLKLILRIFDQDVADAVRERLKINAAFSTSALTAERIVEMLGSAFSSAKLDTT